MSEPTNSSRADGAHYVADNLYAELVAAIRDGRFDPIDPENAVKVALGELGNVWPATIKERG